MLTSIEYHLDYYSELDSTNDYCKSKMNEGGIENGWLVYTFNQTKGRGNSGSWLMTANKNLAFTLCLKPHKLRISDHVYLNMAITLAVRETIAKFGVDASIKWPNDILIDKKKIAGILIENKFQEGNIQQALLGVGINVNQKAFPAMRREGTSLRLELGKEINLENVLTEFTTVFKYYYTLLEINKEKLMVLYHKHLYLLNQEAMFIDSQNQKFNGTIKGVDSNGRIRIMSHSGEEKRFQLKEVTFLD